MCDWKLGVDLSLYDQLLDGITFHDVVTAVHCNCKTIDEKSIRHTLDEILSQRRQDMVYLLENNMDAMILAAKQGRAE